MGSKGNGAPKGTILELFLATLCQVCHSLRFSKIMCAAHSSTWVDEASAELKRDGTRTGSTDFRSLPGSGLPWAELAASRGSSMSVTTEPMAFSLFILWNVRKQIRRGRTFR